MKTATALTFTAVLAGCTATGDTTTPPMPPVGIRPAVDTTTRPVPPMGISPAVDTTTPIVSAPGTSPINPGKQPAFCQDQVAYMYKTEPQYATTSERVVAADGSTTIDVTIDKGTEGVQIFKCRLDANNRFVDVIAATSDGAL